MAIFDLPTAQTLLHKEDVFDGISIQAKDGTSPADLLSAVEPLVPASLEVQDAAAQAEDDAAETNEGMAFIRYFFLGFGAIALFVGSFVIFNTLSITVAQRTREFATLRTLGASRKQVMRSVVLEGLVIGLAGLADRPRRRLRDLQGHRRAVRRASASTCPSRAPSSPPGRSSCRCCSAPS